MGKTLDRMTYFWAMLLLLVAVPVVEWSIVQFVAPLEDYLMYINYVCCAVAAVLTGWRLADAGYPLWAGVAGFILCAFAGPLLTFLVAVLVLHYNPGDGLVLVAIIGTWLLVLLA